MFKIKYFQHTMEFYGKINLQTNELHITQSASLKEYLSAKNQNGNQVFSFKYIMKKLLPEWNNSHTEVYLRSVIRKFLRQKTKSENNRFIEKYLEDFYISFRFLMEIGGQKLYHFEQLHLSEEQILLIELTEVLYKDPVVVRALEEKKSLTKWKIAQKLGVYSPIDTICFHHFDYFDATRVMLFHLLRSLGYKITFYIPYHKEFPELYKSWEILYKHLSNDTNRSWECAESSVPKNGIKFASYLDHKSEERIFDQANISFLKFDHPTSFKEYLHKNPIEINRHDVLAIFEENLNIYTDLTKKNHFYATPYGQFLLTLQNCHKEEDGVKLTYDDYVNLMVSGWVQTGNINGNQSLTLLVDLRHYMEGIASLNEIAARLQSLVELQDISRVFDDLSKESAGRNRLKRYLGNPFRTFPFLHSTRYDITVKQLIECTKDLGRKLNQLLLFEDETQNVQSYFLELKRIFSVVKEKWDIAAVSKMEKLLNIDVPSDWQFHKEEIFQLMSFYLGAEERENSAKILNFDQLVGKTLSSDHIHVTGLSYQTFPWKSPKLPSLLNHTWLKHCINNSFVVSERNLRLHALVVDYNARKLTRNMALYAVYHVIAFAKNKITLSFIDGLQENDGPSIYFTILEELYRKDEVKERIIEIDLFEWDEDKSIQEELPTEVFESIPDLLWLDSDFCNKKFYLDAFIEHHPIYEQDIHQQIVFSTIGKLLAEQGDGEEAVKETLFPLFPHWTNAVKQNLLDTTRISGLRDYKSFQNVYYPKAMKRLQRLYSRYTVGENWKAKYQYDHDNFKLHKHLEEFWDHVLEKEIKANNGHHCRMCQYLQVCKEGEYVIDANDF